MKEEDKQAKAFVEEDQLSLAIGKRGQNVRLAAKLTGWRIDVEGLENKDSKKDKQEDEHKKSEVENKQKEEDDQIGKNKENNKEN